MKADAQHKGARRLFRYPGSIQALFRLCSGSVKALLRLYEGRIQHTGARRLFGQHTAHPVAVAQRGLPVFSLQLPLRLYSKALFSLYQGFIQQLFRLIQALFRLQYNFLRLYSPLRLY